MLGLFQRLGHARDTRWQCNRDVFAACGPVSGLAPNEQRRIPNPVSYERETLGSPCE